MFVVAPGIIGAGTVLTATAGSPLITEAAHPAHRTAATSLCNNFWPLDAIVAAWAKFGTFHIVNSASWRIPSALQGLPSIDQLCGRRLNHLRVLFRHLFYRHRGQPVAVSVTWLQLETLVSFGYVGVAFVTIPF